MKWVSCFCFRPFWSIHPSIAPWSLRVNVLHIRSAQRQQGSVHHQGMKQDLRVRTLASNQMCQVKSPGTVNHGTIETMVNHGRWWQSMVNHGKWWRKHQRSLNDCEVWFTMIYWWLTYPSGIIIPNIWMIYQPVYHDLPWWFRMIYHDFPTTLPWFTSLWELAVEFHGEELVVQLGGRCLAKKGKKKA